MYGIHQLGGWTAIYLSTIILTSVLGISIYFTSNKISKNAPLSAIITFIAMYLMRPYVAARAQLVTFTLMILSIYLIEKYLEKSKKTICDRTDINVTINSQSAYGSMLFFFVIFLPYIAEYILSLDIFTIDLIIKFKIYLLKVFSKENTDEKIKRITSKK